jgi:hypothetical protein
MRLSLSKGNLPIPLHPVLSGSSSDRKIADQYRKLPDAKLNRNHPLQIRTDER